MRIVALLTTIIIGIIIYLSPNLIKIKNINCISNFGQCGAEIRQTLEETKNQSLKNSRTQINKHLSSKNSVSEFDIRFEFPDTLNVYLIEHKPEFAIKVSNSQNFLLVSTEGKILGFSTETPLPKANSDRELSEKQLKFIATLGRKLFLIYGIQNSEIKENSFVTTINDKYSVYFPLNGEIDVLIGSLELILSQLNRTNGSLKMEQDKTLIPSTIDLRYINPVLR